MEKSLRRVQDMNDVKPPIYREYFFEIRFHSIVKIDNYLGLYTDFYKRIINGFFKSLRKSFTAVIF